ncbi:MAG: UDP-N-acetylmuramate dehydrogenase [Treponema sp.]
MINVAEILQKSNDPFCKEHGFQWNIILKEFTSFKIGGKADIYSKPDSEEALLRILTYIGKNKIPVLLLGGGSNILIPDDGIRGMVIHTSGLQRITYHACKNTVEAAAGVSIDTLMEYCAEHSLTGLERFAGLPGTVGGAVYMNARCYEFSISEVLHSVRYLLYTDDKTTAAHYIMQQDDWGYKKSPFQDASEQAYVQNGRKIITAALLTVKNGNADEIRAEMQRYRADRASKGHFRLPSAGSVFKNNHLFGKPSGKLIDEAGLRGLRIGGAQVAPWHGNFIVNTGAATAADVQALIAKTKEAVFQKTGFLLEPEIIFAETVLQNA